MNDAKIKQLLAEYGFLAESDENGDLERSVKDQLTRAATKDEVDTVAFGLETDDGKIVKVYVNAEHAEKFETEMAEMLGEVDDIEEALNQISKDIEVVDVEWPEDEEGDDAEDVDENADDDVDGDDDEDGSEVMNSKVYSKKNLEKEKVKEDTTFGQDITQDLLLEINQNSIANQLSTVNQHLIYQAILHLGVPELAMDKSPYRSAILKGIRNTALELAHSPMMRNTLKMFIKQQVTDDDRSKEDEKFRGDAAKNRHHGDEYDRGLKAAGAQHRPEPHDKDKADADKSEKKQSAVKSKYEVKEDETDSAVSMFWSSLDAVLKMLDPTEGKEHVERLKGSQQFKSLAARSSATLTGRLTSGIRTKLKALQAALGSSQPDEVAESFTNIDAVELVSSMLRLADSQGYADKVIQSQVFKRLSLAGRSTFASVPSSVKRVLQALAAEVGKVKLTEADDELSFDDPESKGAVDAPSEKEPAKKPAAAPAPPPAPVSPDASESGVTFKADGDSLEVKFDGGKISLSGESLERAMKALTNKQTLSVQLDGGKFATVSPRGSSAVIKLMGTESVIKLAPPDISAFIDAAEQVAAGEVENKKAEEVKEALDSWAMLNQKAEDAFGEFGFATLSDDEMQTLIHVNMANKLSQKRFAQDFSTLEEDEMRSLISAHPELIK